MRAICRADSVVDPIADRVVIEGAVGDRGREGERGGVQGGELEMEVDRE